MLNAIEWGTPAIHAIIYVARHGIYTIDWGTLDIPVMQQEFSPFLGIAF